MFSDVLVFTIAEFIMQSRDLDCLYSTGGRRARSREAFGGLVDVFGTHLPSCINIVVYQKLGFVFIGAKILEDIISLKI